MYTVTNITNTTGPVSPTPDGGAFTGLTLHVGDIPGLSIITWKPGQVIDLDLIATRTNILQSQALRVHVNEGRMTVTASAAPGTTTLA